MSTNDKTKTAINCAIAEIEGLSSLAYPDGQPNSVIKTLHELCLVLAAIDRKDREEISIVWSVADIQGRQPTLTAKQARAVIKHMKESSDGSISGEGIDFVCEALFINPPKSRKPAQSKEHS